MRYSSDAANTTDTELGPFRRLFDAVIAGTSLGNRDLVSGLFMTRRIGEEKVASERSASDVTSGARRVLVAGRICEFRVGVQMQLEQIRSIFRVFHLHRTCHFFNQSHSHDKCQLEAYVVVG